MRNILLTEEQFMQCVKFALNEAPMFGKKARGTKGQIKSEAIVVEYGDEGYGPKKKGFVMTPRIASIIESARRLFYPDLVKPEEGKVIKKIPIANIENKFKGEDELVDRYLKLFVKIGIPLDLTEKNRPIKMLRKAIYGCCTREEGFNAFREKANAVGALGVEPFMNPIDILSKETLLEYESYKLDIRDSKLKAVFNNVSTGMFNSADKIFNQAGRRAHASETQNPNEIKTYVNKKSEIPFHVLLGELSDMYNPVTIADNEIFTAEVVFETKNVDEMYKVFNTYFSNSIQTGNQRRALSITDIVNKNGENTKQYTYKIVCVTFNKAIRVDKISLNSDKPKWVKNQLEALVRDMGYDEQEAIELLEPWIVPRGFFVVTSTIPTPTQKLKDKQRKNA
jgi:hypothetical protein